MPLSDCKQQDSNTTVWCWARTCLVCARILRLRCRKRSQSLHRLPHSSQRMIASVSPSSWLSHVGRAVLTSAALEDGAAVRARAPGM